MAPPTEPALSTTELVKRYGRITALHGVSLAVPSGSIAALVGPNGAGKSTLMRTWMGFERPSAGIVRVLGHDPARERSAVLPRVSYFPQSSATYGELTVSDHISVAKHYRAAFDAARAKDRVERLGLRMNARVGRLSGGQRAQLSLALALGMNASVVLLDEPLASLDPLSRAEFLVALRAYRDDTDACIVLSSHILGDIEHICDYLVVLGSGHLLVAGDVSTILSQYAISRSSSSDEPPLAAIIGPDGATKTLVTRAPRTTDERASLEDVVLAFLTLGRDQFHLA